MATLSVLTKELALESSMENDVGSISELMLRGMSLSSVESTLSVSLGGRLTTLSLSHNNFAKLDNFRNLRALEDLNLNFNQLSSDCVMELGECQELRSLYLSTNNLDNQAMVNMTRLCGMGCFKKLEVLCMFSNGVSDLGQAMECVNNLPALADVALEGNECSSKPGYRQSIVRSAKCLRVLDGER